MKGWETSVTLLFNFFANLSSIIVIGVHATGKIFRPSFINGTLYLLVIPISYLSFRLGGEPWTSYLFNVIAVLLGMLSNAYTLHLYVKEFPLLKFVLHDFAPCLLLMGFSFTISHLISMVLDEGWLRFVLVGLASTTMTSLLGYRFILPISVRDKITEKIHRKIWKKA